MKVNLNFQLVLRPELRFVSKSTDDTLEGNLEKDESDREVLDGTVFAEEIKTQ